MPTFISRTDTEKNFVETEKTYFQAINLILAQHYQ